MATIFNQGLYKRIGIEFEYKASFQEFLTEAIGSALVSSYNTGANTPAARTAAKDSFVGCGPSMGFEAKKFAYETLELIVGALVNNADVPAADKTALNDLLVEVTRYVGIAGEEDFHFMVASFQLAEVISKIIGEVVPAPELPVGTILTLELIDGGSGYTYDGTENTSGAIATFTEGAGTTLGDEADETYTAVAVTGGTGTGATFTIVRDNTGAIDTVTLVNAGEDYTATNTLTIDGADIGGVTVTDDLTITVDTVTPNDLTVTIDSTESTNPAGYAAGEADVEITGGVVTSITVLTDGGDGFGVGQVVTLNVDTATHAAGTQDTPAMARVLTVS
jgi:hypothetical protein